MRELCRSSSSSSSSGSISSDPTTGSSGVRAQQSAVCVSLSVCYHSGIGGLSEVSVCVYGYMGAVR
jgi:hypothetical protein